MRRKPSWRSKFKYQQPSPYSTLVKVGFYVLPGRRSYGLSHSHSIYVFDSNAAEGSNYWQPPIYKRISQYISDGYAVIYILEPEEMATVQGMSTTMGCKVEDHIKSGALTIISNDIFYSPSVSSTVLIEQWYKVFSSIQKKNLTLKGFVAMGMPSNPFFMSALNQEHLVDYESMVAKNYDGAIEAICCYTTQSIEKMPLKNVISLLASHQSTAHKDAGGFALKQWSGSRGVSVIKRGLDEALGSRGSELLLRILGREYRIKEADILSHFDRFEYRLSKLLGATATRIILEKLSAEFRHEIVF